MRSASEPPLYSAPGSSEAPGAAFADSWAGPPVSEPPCFASPCPSACASPASGPVFVRLSGGYIYCTDPSCPRDPAADT